MNFDLTTLGPLAASLARAGLPTLGTILGDAAPFPFNMLVKPAFAAIVAALGVDPNAPDPAAQAQAVIEANPDAAVAKLQTVEQAQKDAAEAANRELELRLADVQNARETQTKYVAASSGVQWGAPVVSGVVTVGFVAIVGIMTVHAIPDSSVTSVLVGTLAAAFGAVVNFWLGSSAGSREKDMHLADLAKAPTVTAAAGSHVSAGTITTGARK